MCYPHPYRYSRHWLYKFFGKVNALISKPGILDTWIFFQKFIEQWSAQRITDEVACIFGEYLFPASFKIIHKMTPELSCRKDMQEGCYL